MTTLIGKFIERVGAYIIYEMPDGSFEIWKEDTLLRTGIKTHDDAKKVANNLNMRDAIGGKLSASDYDPY